VVLWSRSLLAVEDLKPQVLDLPVWKVEEQVWWKEWQGLELEDRSACVDYWRQGTRNANPSDHPGCVLECSEQTGTWRLAVQGRTERHHMIGVVAVQELLEEKLGPLSWKRLQSLAV